MTAPTVYLHGVRDFMDVCLTFCFGFSTHMPGALVVVDITVIVVVKVVVAAVVVIVVRGSRRSGNRSSRPRSSRDSSRRSSSSRRSKSKATQRPTERLCKALGRVRPRFLEVYPSFSLGFCRITATSC